VFFFFLNATNTGGVNLLQFFNGGSGNNCGAGSMNYMNHGGASVCTDFVTGYPNNPNLGGLAAHLVSFFGTALGCTAPGFTNANQAVPAFYNGGNLYETHYNMGITAAQFSYFNTQVLYSLLSYAGTLRGGDQGTATTVLGYFGAGASTNVAAAIGFPAATGYSPTTAPTIGGAIGPANGYEAICFVSGCPNTLFAATPTPTPAPTPAPNAAPSVNSGYSGVFLIVSAAAVALVGLVF